MQGPVGTSKLHRSHLFICYARTKHVAIDYHFVRKKGALGELQVRFFWGQRTKRSCRELTRMLCCLFYFQFLYLAHCAMEMGRTLSNFPTSTAFLGNFFYFQTFLPMIFHVSKLLSTHYHTGEWAKIFIPDDRPQNPICSPLSWALQNPINYLQFLNFKIIDTTEYAFCSKLTQVSLCHQIMS